MDSAKQEIIEKLQASNNILVTVSSNPTVDQLAACIGLTLLLNKLDKHATAVFSGNIPSTIEFLKPEETIEKNTNSLRDFIIALDKSKADKLRYKVEDKVVKIFITPYRTSLSADDLNFSQGDFNIDVVLALGVHQQVDLDQAITAHGRILHDAVVACITNTPAGDLGTLNWQKLDASSLSELVVELARSFEQPLLDAQISTALLTGIVAETDRFRNDKTTANTMSLSAELMNAGANQQLVARELDHEIDVRGGAQPRPATQPAPQPVTTGSNQPPKPDDGTLEIDHVKQTAQAPALEEPSGQPGPEDRPVLPPPAAQNINLPPPVPETRPATQPQDTSRSLMTEAPTLGGQLTANSSSEDSEFNPTVDPLSGIQTQQPLLDPSGITTMNTKGLTVQPPTEAGQSRNSAGQAAAPAAPRPAVTPAGQPQSAPAQAPPLPPSQPAAPPAAVPTPPQPQAYVAPPMPPMPMSSPLQPSRAPATLGQAPVFAPNIQPPAPASAMPSALPPMPAVPGPNQPPIPSPAGRPSVASPQPRPAPAVPQQPLRAPQPQQPPAPQPPEPPRTPAPAPNLTEAEAPAGQSNSNAQNDFDEIERARQEVLKAISEQAGDNLPPVQALNAQPVDLGNLHDEPPTAPGGGQLSPPNPPQPQQIAPLPPNVPDAAPFANSPADQPLTMPMPPGINLPPPQTAPPTNAPDQTPNSPPPVPPPLMPPTFNQNR